MPEMLPSPLLPATYHPYAPAEPSRCDSNATLTTPLPSILCHLPSLRSCRALKICLRSCHLISCSSLLLTILMLPQCPQDMPPTPPPHFCTHPSLCLCTPPHLVHRSPSLHYHIRSIV
ncbi:hypothetical protein O181_036560 [Austropuccinia psidii MF-1]|uniref:Uncharacterized protein n=1 Tax=Austropuccinia psidii MF-1 TaxID=1389203 RepID=A0A9Q3D6R4_9BASI|nr:hypothetical protein [Austropuccinia psidii MF-1]